MIFKYLISLCLIFIGFNVQVVTYDVGDVKTWKIAKLSVVVDSDMNQSTESIVLKEAQSMHFLEKFKIHLKMMVYLLR